MMRFHSKAVLVVALLAVVASCGDDASNLAIGGKHVLVQIERVTLATEAPDRVEIEIVVKTGQSLTQPAPDGTLATVTASSGQFAGGGTQARVPTIDGHALVTLLLPPERPAHLTVTATVDTAQAAMQILVDESGSMRLGV